MEARSSYEELARQHHALFDGANTIGATCVRAHLGMATPRQGLFSASHILHAAIMRSYVFPATPLLPKMLRALVADYAMATRLDFAQNYLDVDYACCFVGLIWVDDPSAIGKLSTNGQEVYVHVGELDDLDALAQRLHTTCGRFGFAETDSVAEIADRFYVPFSYPWPHRELKPEAEIERALAPSDGQPHRKLAAEEPRRGWCTRIRPIFG